MKRLPRGFGSVYKLSGSRRNPYAARIFKGYKQNGQPDYLFIGYYKTRQEALNALIEFHSKDTSIDEYNATLGDVWEKYKATTLPQTGERTNKMYNSMYNKHIIKLADKPVRELKTLVLQEFFDNLQLSNKSKKLVLTILRNLFKIAMQLDIVDRDYSSYVNIGTAEKSDKHKPFTDDEIKILWKNKEDIYVQMILILIYTGLRAREFLEIKVENIHIKEQYLIAGSKTKAGTDRTIPIANKILPFIDNLFIKSNKKDIPVSYNVLYYNFKDKLTDLGIKQHIPHDCRYTFATLCDKANQDIVCIKLIMGHTVQDITKGVYTVKDFPELLAVVNSIC